MLVGNKADLEDSRQVPREVGQAQADRLNISFMETSAKSDSGVDEAFTALATKSFNDTLPEYEKPAACACAPAPCSCHKLCKQCGVYIHTTIHSFVHCVSWRDFCACHMIMYNRKQRIVIIDWLIHLLMLIMGLALLLMVVNVVSFYNTSYHCYQSIHQSINITVSIINHHRHLTSRHVTYHQYQHQAHHVHVPLPNYVVAIYVLYPSL